VKSKLDPRLQHLMDLICDIRSMERDVSKMDYDVKKSPLGKITKEQLKAGFEALSRIERHILDNSTYNAEFMDAVNEYYTRIPHYFGMRVPPPIRTVEHLQKEIELLETLAEIEIAVSEMAKQGVTLEEEQIHPMDKHFARLKFLPEPVPMKDPLVAMIDEYLQSTHASTHNRYRMTIRNVYELKEKDNGKQFMGHLGNRKLLWHGSRLSNWFGILSGGLKIAPPEAPVTGYMFGKGVYFADASSKSANYVYPEPGKPGFLMLSEVALGETHDLIHADENIHNRLPTGKHSVRGIGRSAPDPKAALTMDDGVLVPRGKLVQNDHTSNGSPTLAYNEYIVYNTQQIRERYLIEVDFAFDFQL